MPEPIDIPPEAFAAKPVFADFPGPDLVAEVREWVKHSPPWAWRGHTHAAPDADEAQAIRYVADFRLPKGVESPCPCCWPRHPKFGTGFIAWFPNSRCIRLMGRDCFRSLNPEGHDSAIQELDQRTRRAATISYLTANLDKRFEAIRALERAIPMAEQIDVLQDVLGQRLRRDIGVDLWQLLRDGGQLKVLEDTPRGPVFVPHASIEGYLLVDPARKQVLPRLRTALRHLESIDLPLGIINTNDSQRDVAAKAFSRGMTVGKDVVATILDCRKFVSIVSLATIRAWAERPNSSANIYVRRDGLELYIGKTQSSVRRITLDGCIDLPVPTLPDIAV